MAIDFPELREAKLDEAQLEQLFQDIEHGTELIEVLVKGGRLERAADRPVSLEEGRRMLLEGLVRGIQVRYRFEGAEWWDTLMRIDGGARLVRIRHLFEAPVTTDLEPFSV